MTKFNPEKHTTLTIGWRRSDGDFECLATLNNDGQHLPANDWRIAVMDLVDALKEHHDDLEVLYRNDMVDIIEAVDLDDDGFHYVEGESLTGISSDEIPDCKTCGRKMDPDFEKQLLVCHVCDEQLDRKNEDVG